MDIENQDDTLPQEDSIRSDLEKAFEDSIPDDAKDAKADRARDESGKFAKATAEKAAETAELKLDTVAQKVPEAPRSWTAAEKAEWTTMTPSQRAVVLRREQEVEQGFTKLDEDRNFGKSLKDVISPYMALIQSEGSNPVAAIQSLLNTAYILRNAPIQQKTELFHQLAKQYGVDITNSTQAVQPGDAVNRLQGEIQHLRQQIQQQPQVFAQQQETQAIKGQIEAFAADPKHAHYEKLKPVMASLLQSGGATDLQDAYDKASYADPEIRSSILAAQEQEREAQRIAELKAKTVKARNTAVSVRGSPSATPQANGKSNGSIRDDLMAAFDEHAA